MFLAVLHIVNVRYMAAIIYHCYHYLLDNAESSNRRGQGKYKNNKGNQRQKCSCLLSKIQKEQEVERNREIKKKDKQSWTWNKIEINRYLGSDKLKQIKTRKIEFWRNKFKEK